MRHTLSHRTICRNCGNIVTFVGRSAVFAIMDDQVRTLVHRHMAECRGLEFWKDRKDAVAALEGVGRSTS